MRSIIFLVFVTLLLSSCARKAQVPTASTVDSSELVRVRTSGNCVIVNHGIEPAQSGIPISAHTVLLRLESDGPCEVLWHVSSSVYLDIIVPDTDVQIQSPNGTLHNVGHSTGSKGWSARAFSPTRFANGLVEVSDEPRELKLRLTQRRDPPVEVKLSFRYMWE